MSDPLCACGCPRHEHWIDGIGSCRGCHRCFRYRAQRLAPPMSEVYERGADGVWRSRPREIESAVAAGW